MTKQISLGTSFSVLSTLCLFLLSTVNAQTQAEGLAQLATNAEESLFLESCTSNSTSIRCDLSDPNTRALVQVAELRVFPCATPMAEVEFQLLDNGTPRFTQMINTSGDVIIMVFSEQLQTEVPLGTLTTFINHTADTVGIKMDLTAPQAPEPMSLFEFTTIPLDLSACPTTATTTEGETTQPTVGMETTTSNSIQFSLSLWLLALSFVCLFVCV